MPRVGTVPYLNALPLVEGLDREPGIDLVREVPSALVRSLRAGTVDAALVSSVELFRDPALDWIDGVGVTSRGPVQSILLFCNVDPTAVRHLALDASSRSAAVLAQVCLARFLGASVERTSSVSPEAPLATIEADAVLRIGDPALRTRPDGRAVLDLGQVWTDATGLPFVYALWLARPGAELAALPVALGRSLDRGLAARDTLATRFAEEHGMDPAACRHYLGHAIGYTLGDAERTGLALFGRLAHAAGLVDRAELPAPRAHAAA